MPDERHSPMDLVNLTEIGRRTGRSRQAAAEQAAKPDHPPVVQRLGRSRLYRWGPVERYYANLRGTRAPAKPYPPPAAGHDAAPVR